MKRISTLMNKMNTKLEEIKEIPMILIGPRNSGKTRFLYNSYFKFNTEEKDAEFDVLPTKEFNIEAIRYKAYQFKIWDISDPSLIINYLKNENIKVILYMVSSADKTDMLDLLKNYQDLLKNKIILTISNSAVDIQDIGNDWIKDKEFIKLLKNHDWRIFEFNQVENIFNYIINKNNLAPNPYNLTDNEFKLTFEKDSLFLFFDNLCLIRIIYLTLIENNNQQTLNLLHEKLNYTLSTIQQDSIQYSITQTLFWIQMIHFNLLKLPLLFKEHDFNYFLLKTELNQDCWKYYYSQKLFFSEKAATQFLPPDKKSLPNAFKPSSLALKGSGLRIDYEVL